MSKRPTFSTFENFDITKFSNVAKSKVLGRGIDSIYNHFLTPKKVSIVQKELFILTNN